MIPSKPRFVGEKVRLGDVASIEKAPLPQNETVWLLNLDAIEKNTGRVLDKTIVPVSELGSSTVPFSSNSVLYSKLRPNLNKVVLPDEDGVATSEMLPLVSNGSVLDRRYLAAYLRSHSFVDYAVAATAGAKMPRVNRKTVLDATIFLPELREQEKRMDTLDSIEASIDIARQQINQLDQLVKSRFVEVLDNCDLDTVNRLDGCTKRVKVGFVGTVGKYYTDGSGVPMVRTTNITSMGLDLTDLRFVTEEFDRNNTKSHLRSGDVIIARHGENGRACVYQGPEAQCLNVVIIEPDESKLLPICLEYLMNSDLAREQIASMLVGSTQKVVNTKTIASILVPAIPLDLQYRFAAFVTQVDKPRFCSEPNETKEALGRAYNRFLIKLGKFNFSVARKL